MRNGCFLSIQCKEIDIKINQFEESGPPAISDRAPETLPERFTVSSHKGKLHIKVAALADIWCEPAADDKKQEG